MTHDPSTGAPAASTTHTSSADTPKATIKLATDGQSFEVPETLARDDKRLRDLLAPLYPELANAEIRRETVLGQLVVTVTKRAGPKGWTAAVLRTLDSAPETLNPAIRLAWVLQQRQLSDPLDLDDLLALQPDLERATQEGVEERELLRAGLRALSRAAAQPATALIPGF